MNYQKHYDLLCERAKERGEPEGYFERHHVIPKCLGGSDDQSNIVKLTPEEHYLAHQLLVKMHPDHNGLVWAALRMTHHSSGSRTNNKLYGWLRRKAQRNSKARKGKKNGSFGRYWYHHPKTLENIKCLPDEVPEGFIKGRKIRPNNKCKVCDSDTGSTQAFFCEKHRKEFLGQQSKKSNTGRYKVSDKELEEALIECGFNKTKVLKLVGYPVTGYNWKRLTQIQNKMEA